MTKEQRKQVQEEVEVFKTEYPNYTDEHIADYLEWVYILHKLQVYYMQ